MDYTFNVDKKKPMVPYGEVQGVAPGNIPAYSNYSDGFFSGERNFDGELLTGFKYQCVEYARRWLLERKGLMLPDTPWAVYIFQLSDMERACDGEKVRTVAVRNGTAAKPEADTLLIWPSSDDNAVGHVAAIVEAGDGYVRTADQNQYFHKWTGNYSAEYKVHFDEQNKTYTIVDDDGDEPLGWMTFPDTPDRDPSEPLVFDKKYKRPTFEKMEFERVKFIPKETKPNWLDMTQPEEKLFVETFGMDVSRTRLEEQESTYYKCNFEFFRECVSSGNQMHRMFMQATKKVLESDELLTKFCIPEEFWPRLRRSFYAQPNAITGRFDFAFNGDTQELKCFEYNADSASTLLECGVVQRKWAEAVGIDQDTRSSGFRISELLRMAWTYSAVPTDETIHFCVELVAHH